MSDLYSFNPAPDIERRNDDTTHAHVERAVAAQRSGDEWAARDLLDAAGVPPNIALRVLSSPAFRRITRAVDCHHID